MMNKIKLSILGLAIFAGANVFAQEQKQELRKASEATKEQRMENHVDKLAKELELTEKQKQQVLEIRQSSAVEMQKVRNNEELDDEAKRSEMKELREESKLKMAEVLTEEQMLKMHAMRKNHRKNHNHDRKMEKLEENKALKMERKATELAPAEKK